MGNIGTKFTTENISNTSDGDCVSITSPMSAAEAVCMSLKSF